MNWIRVATICAALTISSALLSGCSSDSSSTGGTASGNSASWAPINIGATTDDSIVTLKVGEIAYFNELPSVGAPFTVFSDNTAAVAPLATVSDDTTVTTTLPDPGIVAEAPGKATVEVRSANSASGSNSDPVLVVEIEVVP